MRAKERMRILSLVSICLVYLAVAHDLNPRETNTPERSIDQTPPASTIEDHETTQAGVKGDSKSAFCNVGLHRRPYRVLQALNYTELFQVLRETTIRATPATGHAPLQVTLQAMFNESILVSAPGIALQLRWTVMSQVSRLPTCSGGGLEVVAGTTGALQTRESIEVAVIFCLFNLQSNSEFPTGVGATPVTVLPIEVTAYSGLMPLAITILVFALVVWPAYVVVHISHGPGGYPWMLRTLPALAPMASSLVLWCVVIDLAVVGHSVLAYVLAAVDILTLVINGCSLVYAHRRFATLARQDGLFRLWREKNRRTHNTVSWGSLCGLNVLQLEFFQLWEAEWCNPRFDKVRMNTWRHLVYVIDVLNVPRWFVHDQLVMAACILQLMLEAMQDYITPSSLYVLLVIQGLVLIVHTITTLHATVHFCCLQNRAQTAAAVDYKPYRSARVRPVSRSRARQHSLDESNDTTALGDGDLGAADLGFHNFAGNRSSRSVASRPESRGPATSYGVGPSGPAGAASMLWQRVKATTTQCIASCRQSIMWLHMRYKQALTRQRSTDGESKPAPAADAAEQDEADAVATSSSPQSEASGSPLTLHPNATSNHHVAMRRSFIAGPQNTGYDRAVDALVLARQHGAACLPRPRSRSLEMAATNRAATQRALATRRQLYTIRGQVRPKGAGLAPSGLLLPDRASAGLRRLSQP